MNPITLQPGESVTVTAAGGVGGATPPSERGAPAEYVDANAWFDGKLVPVPTDGDDKCVAVHVPADGQGWNASISFSEHNPGMQTSWEVRMRGKPYDYSGLPDQVGNSGNFYLSFGEPHQNAQVVAPGTTLYLNFKASKPELNNPGDNRQFQVTAYAPSKN
jgi:hypothetical protein